MLMAELMQYLLSRRWDNAQRFIQYHASSPGSTTPPPRYGGINVLEHFAQGNYTRLGRLAVTS
jgi:hypothetical protein